MAVVHVTPQIGALQVLAVLHESPINGLHVVGDADGAQQATAEGVCLDELQRVGQFDALQSAGLKGAIAQFLYLFRQVNMLEGRSSLEHIVGDALDVLRQGYVAQVGCIGKDAGAPTGDTLGQDGSGNGTTVEGIVVDACDTCRNGQHARKGLCVVERCVANGGEC